jgi:hypothetical protein
VRVRVGVGVRVRVSVRISARVMVRVIRARVRIRVRVGVRVRVRVTIYRFAPVCPPFSRQNCCHCLHQGFRFERHLLRGERGRNKGRNKVRSVCTEANKGGASRKRAWKKMKSARERGMHAEKKQFEGREL